MNRDNLLFLVLGVVAGFIVAYLAFEAMAFRQSEPLFGRVPAGQAAPFAGGTAANPAAGPPAAGVPGAGAPGTGTADAPATGGPAAAMEQVQRLAAHVRENPDDLEAVRTLANLNYDIRNWSRAAELYASFLEKSPGDVDVMTDLGACYRQLGRQQEALALFEQVAEQDPAHWQSRYNLILIQAFDLGDGDAASRSLDELLALQPTNPDVQRLATRVRERFGDA